VLGSATRVLASDHGPPSPVNRICEDFRVDPDNSGQPVPTASPPGPGDRPAAGRVFEGAQRVRLGDVRPSARLRLDAAARYLQDLSADDTADAALPDPAGWVVRRTTMEVVAFPRYLERLELATWCSGTGSHFAERRVELVGERGGRISGTTLWVHVDQRSGRPRRLGPAFDALYGASAAGRKVSARLRHPGPPEDAARVPWALRTTDLDVLGHVNNAVYWEVVEQALVDRLELRAPLRAEVEHRVAVEQGAVVEWVVQDQGEGLAVWVLANGSVAASAVVAPLAPA
jgi:acyl-ACP thioesterase